MATGDSIQFVHDVKGDVENALAQINERLRAVIRHIHENPELAMNEHIAHDTICDFMEGLGLQVTRHAYGVDTAFEVLSGEGGRKVGINAEYDALPDVGHACGHNLIAASSLATFFAMHYTLQKRGIPGRVQLLGTPAEENLGGKAVLLEKGAYEGIDAVLMSHPCSTVMVGDENITTIGGANFLADRRLSVEFFGKATHAAASPWLGINAYDAAVAAHTNIGLLRQHIHPFERVHGCLQECPRYANVIGEYARAYYICRSSTKKLADVLQKRVRGCFEAAAQATGCEIKISEVQGYDDFVPSPALNDRYAVIAKAVGIPGAIPWDGSVGKGSSDIGNVSYKVPALHSMFTIPCEPGISVHEHKFAAAAGTDEAFAESQKIGKILALLGLEVLTDDGFYSAVKSTWDTTLAARLK